MSFDFPAQPQRRVQPRRGGCGRLIFMLMIAFAVYYMFMGGRGGPQNRPGLPPEPGDIVAPRGIDGGRESTKKEIFGDGTVDSGGRGVGERVIPPIRKMPSTGRSGAGSDWQMQDVQTKEPSRDFRNDSRLPTPSNRSKNDWSIGDADAPTAEAVPGQRQTAPRKKSKSDWSFEEVD